MGGLLNDLIPIPTYRKREGSKIGDHSLSTSCGAVKWPDHHCGGDLVKEHLCVNQSLNEFDVLDSGIA